MATQRPPPGVEPACEVGKPWIVPINLMGVPLGFPLNQSIKGRLTNRYGKKNKTYGETAENDVMMVFFYVLAIYHHISTVVENLRMVIAMKNGKSHQQTRG